MPSADRLIRHGCSVARLAILAAVTGCASHAGPVTRVDLPVQPASGLEPDERAVVHVLNRATFGPRPGDAMAVASLGIAHYLDLQLHPDRVDDSVLEARLAAMPTLSATPRAIADEYVKPADMERRRRQAEVAAANAASMASGGGAASTAAAARPPEPDVFKREREVLSELNAQKILRAVYSERQLQEVLVDFWFNHFNVFVGKGADRLYVAEYENSVLRPRVFGTFRSLLGAVAESPAMLFYLDNWLSTDPNGLHPAPAARLTAGRRAGRPLPVSRPPVKPAQARSGLNENYARELMELHTLGVDGGYTQRDVTEVARCFTGWTIAGPNNGGGFSFDPRRHDEGEKVVLGHVIRAGGGKSDGDRVLDILASHPSTARFVATKLVRRFVADDPPGSLVERAAARFRETHGDLREVVRTILMSGEFASPGTYASKVKTPLEFVVSALRATSARVDNPAPAVNALRVLGMPVYGCQPPTGYADRADAWAAAGTLLERMSFAAALSANRLPGIFVDLPSLAGSAESAVDRARLAHVLIGPDQTPATIAILARQSSIRDEVALALGSPDFQRR